MFEIFVCEDHPIEAAEYEKIINEELKANVICGNLTYICSDAISLLEYLKAHPAKQALYFLDICLPGRMNGIQLASIIRDMDTFGSIVFVTSKSEMSYMTFQYYVEAMDFIIKDHIEELPGRIRKCMHKAYIKYRQSHTTAGDHALSIKVGGVIHYLAPCNILYIQTARLSQHKVEICLTSGVESVYGTLKEFEAALSVSDKFFRCHQSVIVNKEHISRLEWKTKTIVMKNGDSLPISVRYTKKVMKTYCIL